jgi:transketolase
MNKNSNSLKNDEKLEQKANLVRKWRLRATTAAGSGHPTSCLSPADITTVLFDKYFTYDIKSSLNLYNDRYLKYRTGSVNYSIKC